MGIKVRKKEFMMASINVTPLVDVVLVLLAIFMITAPLLLNGIELKLPQTKEVNRIHLTTKQVVLSVSRAEEYFIGKDKYLYKEIIPEVLNLFKKNSTNILYLRADYGISYGKVAKLMSHLKNNGIANIALVTETEE
jgi:biopolymer transport protein ExbD